MYILRVYDGGRPLGDVIAWRTEVPTDEQGTPIGSPIITLAGYADIMVAAQLIEDAVHNEGLLWVCNCDQKPEMMNLRAIWGSDVFSTRVLSIRVGAIEESTTT